MTNIETLIDKASKTCGSDAQLARKMGISQSTISDMRHRGRTVTPETAAELAAIAGEDAREAAIEAIVQRAKGTRRESVLRGILGKGMVTVAVIGVVTASALWPQDVSASSLKTTFHDVYCDFLKAYKALLRHRRYKFC